MLNSSCKLVGFGFVVVFLNTISWDPSPRRLLKDFEPRFCQRSSTDSFFFRTFQGLQGHHAPIIWHGCVGKKTTKMIEHHPGSAIRTLLHGKINPKDWQVLPLGDVGFSYFFRVVSGDYGRACHHTVCLNHQVSFVPQVSFVKPVLRQDPACCLESWEVENDPIPKGSKPDIL